MPQQQALLKRNPSMTPDEFTTAWLRHGALVLPYFLSYGFQYYAQIHWPLTPPVSNTALTSEELANWDGAAESIQAKPPIVLSAEEEAWRSAYYHDVILPDERRFLVSPALDHLKIAEGVEGRKTVVIEGGKGMIDVPEEIMAVWMDYEKRGGVTNE